MSSQPQRVTSGQTHKQMHISKFSFLNWIHKIIPYMNIKHTYTNTNFWSIDSCQKRHNGVGGGGGEVGPCQKSTWGWGERGWSLSKEHMGVGGKRLILVKRAHGGGGGRTRLILVKRAHGGWRQVDPCQKEHMGEWGGGTTTEWERLLPPILHVQ